MAVPEDLELLWGELKKTAFEDIALHLVPDPSHRACRAFVDVLQLQMGFMLLSWLS